MVQQIINKSVDVLVVGLGPGGGSALLALADSGLRVLGIDRRQQLGAPVQCAELVPKMMFCPIPVGQFAIQSIEGMTTHLSNVSHSQRRWPGLMIDRQAFDREIVGRAVDRGVNLMVPASLRHLNIKTNLALVKTPDVQYRINYRLLIAADGPRSVVARMHLLPRLKTLRTRQYTVSLSTKRTTTDVWLGEAYPGGYAWMFPKHNQANLGLGVDNIGGHDLKTPLHELHQDLVDRGTVGKEIYSRTGGDIPVSGLRNQLVVADTLFVGDAAGLTHPITGAGIAAAVYSGESAGRAVRNYLVGGDKQALVEYETEIRELYEPNLRRAVLKRQQLRRDWQRACPDLHIILKRGWIGFDEYYSP
jgi:digeranylgeranylglycerophospholipid reductase